MEEKNTELLFRILENADRREIDQYQKDYLREGYSGFPAYMDAMLAEKQMKRQDVFQKADLPQKYGYKLLSGESHTKDRDKLLRIFISMKMSLKETQRALALYGMPALYPKIKRDAILIIALNRGCDSVDTVDEWLQEAGEDELSRSGE